ncbi:hypothetical protein LB507_003400 [Fusarium sp. FIESC RH6]|nr:hypothetical protein LB507_003400 [Fusarium sp. FIESC RH6]
MHISGTKIALAYCHTVAARLYPNQLPSVAGEARQKIYDRFPQSNYSHTHTLTRRRDVFINSPESAGQILGPHGQKTWYRSIEPYCGL